MKININSIRRYGLRLFFHKTIIWIKNRISLQKSPNDFFYPIAEQDSQQIHRKLTFSILLPVYNTPKQFLEELLSSIQNQSYERWELCIVDASPDNTVTSGIIHNYQKTDDRIKYKALGFNKGIADNSNEALKIATGDVIVLIDHDDLLEECALEKILGQYNQDDEIDVVYTDEDKISMDGSICFDRNHKPEFNLMLLRNNNYICHLFSVKCDIAKKVGGFKREFEGAQDYDFIFRCVENARKIGHVPEIMYHWRSHYRSTAGNPQSKMYAYEAGKRAIESHLKRMQIDAVVELTEDYGFYNVRYKLKSTPKVSIVVCGEEYKIKKAIKRIKRNTAYPMYKFEKVNEVMGDYIVFINEKLRPISKGWIEELLSLQLQDGVGAVSGKIYTKKEKIYYAGTWKDIAGEYVYQFRGMDRTDSGYFHRQNMVQEIDGASELCFMTSRQLWRKWGENYGALRLDKLQCKSFCDKAQKDGMKIIFQPHAEFYIVK